MRIALAALTVVLLAPAAFADPLANTKTPTPPPALSGEHVTDDCARARAHGKTCIIDMGNETVDGNTVAPPDISINVVPMGKYGSLINIRRDFLDKIVKTADDL